MKLKKKKALKKLDIVTLTKYKDKVMTKFGKYIHRIDSFLTKPVKTKTVKKKKNKGKLV